VHFASLETIRARYGVLWVEQLELGLARNDKHLRTAIAVKIIDKSKVEDMNDIQVRVGMRRAGSADVGRGRAVVGVATGTAGLLAAIVGVMLTLVVIDVYEAYVDPAAHVVTVTDCEVDGSRATVAGLLENRSSESADFSVLIGFARAGTDNVRHTRRAVLNNVAPGEQAAFELQQQVDLDEVDCLILEVTGPLPFGIALD